LLKANAGDDTKGNDMGKTAKTDNMVAVLTVPDCLNSFEAQAMVASNSALSLVLHGTLALFVAVEMAEPGKADSIGNVCKTLTERVTRTRKVKGKAVQDKMLAIYVRCAKDLFNKWAGRGDNSAHPAIYDAILKCKIPSDAIAAMLAYLTQAFGDDVALSLNQLRKYLKHGTGHKAAGSPADKLANAVSAAVKAQAADKLEPTKAAAIAANVAPPSDIMAVLIDRLVAAKDWQTLGKLGDKLVTLSATVRKDSEADKAREPKPVNAKPVPVKPAIVANVAAH
jgi:hypothetical protein